MRGLKMEMSNWIEEVNKRLPEDYVIEKIASGQDDGPYLAVTCRRQTEHDMLYPTPITVGYESDIEVFFSVFYKELMQFYVDVEKALRVRLRVEQSATCKTEVELERLGIESGIINDAKMLNEIKKSERDRGIQ